jgi:hypothetical protein
MNRNEILQKIIDEEGNCSWSNKHICALCPLSKLKQRKDGNYYSCVDAVGVDNMTEEESDARYKEIAKKLLVDEAIDGLLAGDLDEVE